MGVEGGVFQAPPRRLPTPTPPTSPPPTLWRPQHELLVSSIDWHAGTNRIVTCSHDRNAFVWTLSPDGATWSPTVVILHVDRAALDVKWSPDGLKFAVGSGNKNAMLCVYDPGNNWWLGSPVKTEKRPFTAKSSVVSVAWHPCSQVLACCSTDWKVRVLFTFTEGVDSAPFGGPFGSDHAFGKAIVEYEQTRSWVNDAQWSPSGNQLAWVAQDGLLHIVSFASADGTVTVRGQLGREVGERGLPSACMVSLSPSIVRRRPSRRLASLPPS